jgi:hypothetical protein
VLSGNEATVVFRATVALEMLPIAAIIAAPSARTWLASRARGKRIVALRMLHRLTIMGRAGARCEKR